MNDSRLDTAAARRRKRSLPLSVVALVGLAGLMYTGLDRADAPNRRRLARIGDYHLGQEVTTQGTKDINSNGKVVAQGAGPELTGLVGQKYNFDGEERWFQKGMTWYNILESRRFQWNMAPVRWDNCPDGENMFLGYTGFTFNEPDMNNPARMISKHLQFRLHRADDRSCLFNHSETCLAGGNFIMNFDVQGRNVLHPGQYSLKTNEGVIRIVAYNVHQDCNRRYGTNDQVEYMMKTDPATYLRLKEGGEKRPIDYLRQTKSTSMNPEGCEAWMKEREQMDDLFSYNSDQARVYIDTKWMQIAIEVRQNKVPMEGNCDYASMNIHITDMSPEVMQDEVSGVLGATKLAEQEARIMKGRALRYKGIKAYEVEGPFASTREMTSGRS